MAMTLEPVGGGRRRGGRHRPRAEINVTPFVDVMLVLLVVFILSAPLLTVGIQVDLPKIAAAPLETAQVEPLNVTVASDGQVYLQETAFPIEELASKLAAVAVVRPERREEPVVVRATAEAPYARVAVVLDALRKAGFTKVGLQTDPVGAPPPAPAGPPSAERPVGGRS